MGMKNLFRTCYQRNFRIRYFSTASRAAYNGTYEIGILGAPLHKGQRKSGVHHGPRAIRDGGLTDRMRHVGVTAADYGDLDFDQSETSNVHKTSFEVGYASPIFNLEFVAKATRMVSEKVSQIVKSRDVCLTLGGDHSIGIGTVHGHANVNPDLGVIWVDAHPDLNLPQTTPSGNLHGMALAMVLKECENNTKDIPGFEWLKSRVSASRVGFIGLREIDDGEAALLRKLNICHFSIRDIDRNGIALCMEQMLDILNPTGRRPLHVSYDIDSIDPSIAPSTGTPVMGGLTYREALYIAEEIARTGCMRAMDLVEVNPKLGSEDNSLTTARIAVDVIAHALGLEIRGVQKKITFMDREEDDTKIILQTRTLPDDFKDSLPNDLIAKTSK